MSTANSKLLQEIKGIPAEMDALVILVKTEWNSSIVDELENGCVRLLKSYGVQHQTLLVPGAVEIAFAIQQYWANSILPKAFIALGCVVKGDTPHFDYVCRAVTDGNTGLNLLLPVPVIFGVLTVNTNEQALERIGGKHGHKGEEAALTAIKMIALNRQLKELGGA